MSSKGSKRTAQRRQAAGPIGQLKKEIQQLKAALGEARMSVLNMRQMYRQAEQELAQAQAAIQAKETLAATILFLSDETEIIVTREEMEALSEGYARLDVVPSPDGSGTLVRLVPHEGIEFIDEDEEDDTDVSEVPEGE